MCFVRLDLVFLIRVARRVVGSALASALGLLERWAGVARAKDQLHFIQFEFSDIQTNPLASPLNGLSDNVMKLNVFTESNSHIFLSV